MKYIAGQPHKQINKVYFYSKACITHIYGDYYQYLKDNNIEYLNIAYEGNRVYFIPCLTTKEINVIPKPIKISKAKTSFSFTYANLFKMFNIDKSTNNGTKFIGNNLKYTQIDIDKNSKKGKDFNGF